MGDEPDLAKLTGGLGESWEIAKNTYKPYPAGIVFHAVIDACLKLRPQLADGIDDIESVTVQGSQLLLDRGDRAVTNERDARVSIHHSAACGLLLGKAGVREFSEAVVFEPAVVRFRDKVRAQLDASLPDGAALVTVRTRSGKISRETVMSARGSLSDPLSDADIENKLRECIHIDGNSCDPDKLIEAVWHLEQLPDVAGLMNASRGDRP
jgi:2-methylcitrate dehydratase PrpD